MSIAERTPGTDEASLSSAGPKGVGAGGILAAIGMALAGFVATAGLIHLAIRNPLHLHADIRSEKLAILQQLRGKFFSSGFGSSRVHDGFNGAAFDAAMADSPEASSSENLAVEGGSQTEQFAMAQEFLRNLEPPAKVGAPPQPCYLILELSAGVNLLDPFHPRSINIYDLTTARLATHFASADTTWKQRYGRIGYAVGALALHYMNVGMLSNTIFTPPVDAKRIALETSDDRRGQDVLPYFPSNIARMHRIADGVPRLPATAEAQVGPGYSELVERLAAMSPVRHVSFVYVVMPMIGYMRTVSSYPDHLTVAGPDGPLQVPIINMAQPAVYPEIYNPELWYDEDHLNGAGAALFSKLLGEQLKKWYATHGDPPPCG